MKRLALASAVAVLALGMVNANGLFADQGSVISYPLQLMQGQRTFSAVAGKTTYVEIAQTRLDLTPSSGSHLDTGYAYDRFAVASESVPQGWGVALMDAKVVTLQDPFGSYLDAGGKPSPKAVHAADNTFAVNVPAGTYRLQVVVRNNNTQATDTVALSVTVQ